MGEATQRPVWGRRYLVRRDCEPHRGPFLALLGTVSLWCGILAVCLAAPAVAGVALGVVAWVLAERDLTRMGRGLLDPSGRTLTERGQDCALLGVLLSLTAVVCWAALFLLPVPALPWRP